MVLPGCVSHGWDACGYWGATTIAIVVVAAAVAVVSRAHPTMLGCALAMTSVRRVHPDETK